MNKFAAVAMSTATLAVLVLNTGAGAGGARGGGAAGPTPAPPPRGLGLGQRRRIDRNLAGCPPASDQPRHSALAKLDHGCGEVYRPGGRRPGQAGRPVHHADGVHPEARGEQAEGLPLLQPLDS